MAIRKMSVENTNEMRELKTKIKKLKNSLGKRIKRIEKAKETYKYTAEKYNKLDKNIRGKSKTELNDLYRDLLYINNLKTSRYKGAINAYRTYQKVEFSLQALSPRYKDKFWEAYGRIYENYGGAITEKYKYIFFEAISERMYMGQSVDDIAKEIIEKFDAKWEQSGEDDEFEISTSDIK